MSKRFRERKGELYTNALSAKYRELNNLTAGRLDFLGGQLETGRSLICQYGYPESPTFNDYYTVYSRIGLAAAGCDVPVNDTWSEWPQIQEVTKFKPNGEPDYSGDTLTKFEKAAADLFGDRKLNLKQRVKSLDRKQRIGDYAGSLIVARDVSGAKMDQPLENLLPGQLVKLVPLYQSQLKECEWDNEPSSPGYGEPTMYQVIEFATGAKSQGQNRSFNCHPSRLIMAAEGSDDGTNQGRPAMQSCFYALMDWEKIRMSSAEGMKKNADQRTVMSLKEGSNIPTGETAEIMDENISDFERGESNTLMISEATLSALNTTMSDPTKSSELCEKEIAAGFKRTMTGLMGYQTGKLASEKDNDKDAKETVDRRNGFGTELLLDHITRFIELGLLPQPQGEIFIEWADAREPSESDKLAMAKTAAEIRKIIFDSGSDGAEVIPDSYFHDKLSINIDDIDFDRDTGGEELAKDAD